MRLRLRGPEIGDAEARFEVRAEVVHVADGEGEIHAELDGGNVSVGERGKDGGRKDGEGEERKRGDKTCFEDFEVGAAEVEGAFEEFGEHFIFLVRFGGDGLGYWDGERGRVRSRSL